MTEAEMLADLRRQAVENLRAGYDGHNRHSQHVTMAKLRVRARRRVMNRVMAEIARGWQPERWKGRRR